jgi:tripeptide aminopeptidase
MSARVLRGALPQICLAAALAGFAQAQEPRCDPAADSYCAELQRIEGRPDIARAYAHIEATDAQATRDLIELTEIPAPPFREERCEQRSAELLHESGADSVWLDAEGNALGVRRGTRGGRTVVISGHLDTVFPEGTDVTVRQRGDTLFAPGIADDTRGLVVVLQVLRALVAADIRTPDDLLFVGTVGEEGLGDLRGVKHLFRDGGPRIDAFITVDGGSDATVTHQGLGSLRYRVTVRGPGGHSWGDFGAPSPIHVLADAIRRFDTEAAVLSARGPRTSYNVGQIGGGTSVNSIAAEAWLEVDMRSVEDAMLRSMDSVFHAAMRAALEPFGGAGARALTLDIEQIGNRPSGATPRDAPLVRRAAAATRMLGSEPSFGRSSTDANVPIALGVPAIAIGRGGVGGGAHSPGEWWLNRDGTRAIRKALLILVAEAGLR